MKEPQNFQYSLESKNSFPRIKRYSNWLWILITVVIINFTLVAGLHFYEQNRHRDFHLITQDLRQAHEDLMLGLLHLSLSNEKFERYRSAILIEQSINSYRSVDNAVQREKVAEKAVYKVRQLILSLEHFLQNSNSMDEFTLRQQSYMFSHRSAEIRREVNRELTFYLEKVRLLFNSIMLFSCALMGVICIVLKHINMLALKTSKGMQESEKRFRQLTDHITDVFWLADVKKQQALYVSPAFEHIWGRSIMDFNIDPDCWFKAIVPEDQDKVARFIKCENSEISELEYRIKRPTGEIRWIKDMAFPVLDINGHMTRIAGVARDITELRREREELSLLKEAVSHLNDIVMISEVNNTIASVPKVVFVNQAFERITGYRENEIMGETPKILYGPRTDTNEIERIRACLSNWQPVKSEVTNYRKDGQEIRLELDIVPLSNKNGHFTHWVSIVRDVTQRRKLEEQLHQSQRMEALGQLTGGIAHDFNNLLTVIWGNADLLDEQLQDNKVLAQLASTIVKAAESGANLTQRLLAFARQQTLSPEKVDIQNLLLTIEPLLRRAAGEQINFQMKLDQTSSISLVDPAQLESAILNLCVNGRDAMPEGGTLIVKLFNTTLSEGDCAGVEELEPGPYICIEVTDSGIGIDPKVLPRVFEPLFTTKEKGKGTGLGLSMVFGFVRQSKGHVTIESEINIGTRICLFLPETSKQGKEHSVERIDKFIKSRKPVNILLVEEDSKARLIIADTLRDEGYRVVEAASSEATAKIIKQEKEFSLLIATKRIIGFDGRFHKLINELNPDLGVLIMLESCLDFEEEFGLKGQNVNYLRKPVEKETLLHAITTINS